VTEQRDPDEDQEEGKVEWSDESHTLCVRCEGSNIVDGPGVPAASAFVAVPAESWYQLVTLIREAERFGEPEPMEELAPAPADAQEITEPPPCEHRATDESMRCGLPEDEDCPKDWRLSDEETVPELDASSGPGPLREELLVPMKARGGTNPAGLPFCKIVLGGELHGEDAAWRFGLELVCHHQYLTTTPAAYMNYSTGKKNYPLSDEVFASREWALQNALETAYDLAKKVVDSEKETKVMQREARRIMESVEAYRAEHLPDTESFQAQDEEAA